MLNLSQQCRRNPSTCLTGKTAANAQTMLTATLLDTPQSAQRRENSQFVHKRRPFGAIFQPPGETRVNWRQINRDKRFLKPSSPDHARATFNIYDRRQFMRAANQPGSIA